MSNGFYDGYPFGLEQIDVFRHSNVTGIVGVMVMNQDSQVQQVEVWPQADRTSGVGTLTTGISASATTLTYTPGATGFVLGFACPAWSLPRRFISMRDCFLLRHGNREPTDAAESWHGWNVRAGMADRDASSPNSTFISVRYPLPPALHRGSGVKRFAATASMDRRTAHQPESRFEKAEQDLDGSQKLLTEFEKSVHNNQGNRQVMGPRQVQAGQGSGVEICAGAGGYFGGVILP